MTGDAGKSAICPQPVYPLVWDMYNSRFGLIEPIQKLWIAPQGQPRDMPGAEFTGTNCAPEHAPHNLFPAPLILQE